jgi:hypothetical protein
LPGVDDVPEASDADPLDEALNLIRRAADAEIPLRLVGGLAVRVLCPDFHPRVRDRQDLDLASTSTARSHLTELLVGLGYEPDRRFNALYGHKQLYFASPRDRAVDVLVDTLEMCHLLHFRDRIGRMPLTLDVTDLLLSKLQIVQINLKDVQDVVYLLAAYPVDEDDEPGTIGLDRIRTIVADDWGWWRTLTGTVEHVLELVGSGNGDLVPAGARHDVPNALTRIRNAADDAPKTLRWKLRARIGERKRWYQVPDEEAHD